MRRLLFVVTDDWYFVSHRLALARAAMHAGYHVGIATNVQRHGDVLEKAGLEVFPVPWKRRGTTIANELRTIIALRRVYAAYRPDVIHNVAMRPVLYGSIAARRVPSAIVVNAIAGRGYAFTSNTVRARIMRPLVRIALRMALGHTRTRVILQNPEDRDVIRGSRPDREGAVTVIRGAGVDLTEFPVAAFPPGNPVVMLAARMLRDKGVGDFVEAARRVQASHPDVRFVLVGDTDPGNYSAIPREALRAWHESGAVEWWGRREDMPAALAASHVLCLPSTSGEGVPKVLIEGAATGRPLIATDVPGCREIVRHGVNGLLVPPHDVPALVDAIGTLVANAALREQMGLAGRALVAREFALDQVVAATLPLYAE